MKHLLLSFSKCLQLYLLLYPLKSQNEHLFVLFLANFPHSNSIIGSTNAQPYALVPHINKQNCDFQNAWDDRIHIPLVIQPWPTDRTDIYVLGFYHSNSLNFAYTTSNGVCFRVKIAKTNSRSRLNSMSFSNLCMPNIVSVFEQIIYMTKVCALTHALIKARVWTQQTLSQKNYKEHFLNYSLPPLHRVHSFLDFFPTSPLSLPD